MAALAWRPGAGEPKGWLDRLETDDERVRERAEEQRGQIARRAYQRLEVMRARKGDGARFAAIVWYVYGERGEKLDEREECAVLVADRWALAGERAAFRAQLKRRNPGMRDETLNAMTPIGFGNALIGVAVAAYERDEWADVATANEEPKPARSETREEFAQRVRASFENAAAELARASGAAIGRFVRRRLARPESTKA
jgi:hypothetical protein